MFILPGYQFLRLSARKNIYQFKNFNNNYNGSGISRISYCQCRFNSTVLDKITNSSVIRYSMDNLISLHEWSQMPWFLEIAAVTIAARTLVAFPLTILQRRILYRYEALKPEIEMLSKNLYNKIRADAYLAGITKQSAGKIYRKMLFKEINRLIVRDNCHPMKATLVMLFQVPFWITLSYTYRNFAYLLPDSNDPKIQLANEQLQQEGALWFQNLIVPDPTGIIPVLNCLTYLAIIQIHINERKRAKLEDSMFIKLLTNGSRLFSLALIPIGLTIPANITFYWLISSVFGLLQNILLLNPNVKKRLKLSKM